MAHVSRGNRIRLARILGMLGSEHEGERAAAALAADRMIHELGVTWWDILAPEYPATPRASRWVDPLHDPLRAAESRMRQLRRENADLKADLTRLKRFLDARNRPPKRRE